MLAFKEGRYEINFFFHLLSFIESCTFIVGKNITLNYVLNTELNIF